MQNISLNQFYKKINKKILLVGAYLGDKELYNIIRGCRLKPIGIFGENFDWSTKLERLWVDEFNNRLEIKKKKIKIILNSKPLQTTTTDIYKNSSIKFIINNSSSICIGISGDAESWIVFRGNDDFLRCYHCSNDQITICSPLIVGIKVLKCLWQEIPSQWKPSNIKSELKYLDSVQWIVAQLPLSRVFEPKLNNQLKKILYVKE